MAYLTGITTWGNLLTDFRELICGRKADDYGNSVPANEQWRDPHAGLGGTGAMILAPPSIYSDRESLQEHRQGYWARIDDCAVVYDRTGSHLQHVRQTSIWNNWHTRFQESLILHVKVTRKNDIADDYSTAQIRWTAYSLSTTGAIDGLRSLNNADVNLDAAGNITLTYTSTTSSSCTIRVTNPETGFLEPNTIFVRFFKNEYRGGIDAWRNYIKKIGNTTEIVPPSGTQYVDWDRTGQNTIPQSGGDASFALYPSVNQNYHLRLQLVHGLGIKTNAGLSGERYEISFNYCQTQLWFYTSGTEILWRWGPPGILGNGSLTLGVEGGHGSNDKVFLNAFATVPASTTEIQYFITVRNDALAITLYGDSSVQGRLTTNMIARISGYDEEDPNVTWGIGRNQNAAGSAIDRYHRLGPSMTFEKVMVRGWMDGGRNWQTGDGRWDTLVYLYTGSSLSQDHGFVPIGYNFYDSYIMSMDGTRATIPNTNSSPDVYVLLKEPGWRASSWTLNDGSPITDITSLGISPGYWRERGYLENPPLLLVPQGSYAAGDELLDLTTNNRYKLFGRNSYSGWISSQGPGYLQAMF